MKTKKKSKQKMELAGGWIPPVCVCLGLSIGCALGIWLGSIPLGTLLGMVAGGVAGTLISSQHKQEKA